MMKPEAFVENIMLRSMIRDLADSLERELNYRYKKRHGQQARVYEHEMELVKKARNRLNEL